MSWFTPKCPVDKESKDWLEGNFSWLIEEFGAEKLRMVKVILPTDEFFPDIYSPRREDVRLLLDSVCRYMEVNPGRVALRFFTDDNTNLRKHLPVLESSGKSAAGSYREWRGKYILNIETSQLNDPLNLVATIAHELGHARLLGENRITSQDADHEPLTDLATIFFGLGIFTANSSFVFRQWTGAFSQGWQAGKQGYLTEEMFGYALALFAFIRGENNPAWSSYLSINVKTYFGQSLKFLEKTNDTTLERI